MSKAAKTKGASGGTSAREFQNLGLKGKSSVRTPPVAFITVRNADSDWLTMKGVPSFLSVNDPAGGRKKPVGIWPEWNSADLLKEIWDTVKGSKEKEKPKGSPTQPAAAAVTGGLFEDPEGLCELPASLTVCCWKRPHELELPSDVTPVVVDVRSVDGFDFISFNQVQHESELMRWITSQISSLWQMTELPPGTDLRPGSTQRKTPQPANNNANAKGKKEDKAPAYTSLSPPHSWYPWDHIHTMGRTPVADGKTSIPAYNPSGKYLVKLFWMGCWRKITVDDLLPFDSCGRLLLPCSALSHELWPMLLTKALLKVAALDYQGGSSGSEFGDFSVIHCLTGWLPEVIPLRYGQKEKVWDLLCRSVPQFKWPDTQEKECAAINDAVKPNECDAGAAKPDLKKKEKEAKDPAPAKDDKKKKEKGEKAEKDDRSKEKRDEEAVYEKPEVVIFAAYEGLPKQQMRISQLSEMANSSEILRQNGLSHHYPHPVLISQVRTLPLDPPPPPPDLPRWKLIRPKKPIVLPTAEPAEAPEPEKPIQSLKMTSYFLNYRTRPLSLPPEMISEEKDDEDDYDGTHYVPPADDCEFAICATLDEEVQQKLEAEAAAAAEAEAAAAAAEAASAAAAAATEESPGKAGKKKGKKGEQDKKGNEKAEAKISAKDKKNKKGQVSEPEGSSEPQSTDKSFNAALPVQRQFDFWMDFDVMCKCFRTLYVYHKPQTYSCNQKVADLSKVQVQGSPAAPPPARSDKKNIPVTNSSSNTTLDGQSPHYLMVDSLCPIEILVSLSALSAWNEVSNKPQLPAVNELLESPTTNQKPPKDSAAAEKTPRDQSPAVKQKAAASSAPAAAVVDQSASISPAANAAAEETCSVKSFCEKESLEAGLLIAEPFSWKSLTVRRPVLKLRSTSITSAVVCLPAGRHVLRLTVSAPLCYQVHVCSSTGFILGDEDKVLSELTTESCRYVDMASRFVQTLSHCMETYGDPDLHQCALNDLWALHWPVSYVKAATESVRLSAIKHHNQVYLAALYVMLRKVLSDNHQMTPSEITFALRVFNRDCTTKQTLTDSQVTQKTAVTANAAVSDRSAQPQTKSKNAKKRDAESQRIEQWKTKEISCSELESIITLQRMYRGHLTRRILHCYQPGSEEMCKIQEQLQKLSLALEHQAVEYGLLFYREIFYVHEETLCVPRLAVPSVPTARLRVIDNDTGCEIEQVFCKVVPHTYCPNKTGYTFLCEGRTGEEALKSDQWRLRLIGSMNPLPVPSTNQITSSFHVIQLNEYYVPNDESVICRYQIKTVESLLASIRLHTSSPDVHFCLTLYDFDRAVSSAEVRCQAVLPSVLLLPDPTQITLPEDQLRSASRSSTRLKSSPGSGRKQQPAGSGSKDTAKLSNSSRNNSTGTALFDEAELLVDHKYILEAKLVRTGWPLTPAQWDFICSQQTHKTEDTSASNKVEDHGGLKRTGSATSRHSTSSRTSKDRTSPVKSRQAESRKDRDRSLPRTSTLVFDECRAGWSLSIVLDSNKADMLMIDKYSEREECLRVMKKAWEEAEPGRAAKAHQSRISYLNSHTNRIRVKSDEGAEVHKAHKGDKGNKTQEGGGEGEGAQAVPNNNNSARKSAEAGKSASTVGLKGKPAGSERPPSNASSVAEEQKKPATPPAAVTAVTADSVPPGQYIEQLAAVDITPFLRSSGVEGRVKENGDALLEMEKQREEIGRYRAYRQRVEQWRENERAARNYHKAKQLQLIENLQETLDMLRAGLNCPREMYRQKMIAEDEAAKRQAEEQVAVEAQAAVELLGKKKKPAEPKKTKK